MKCFSHGIPVWTKDDVVLGFKEEIELFNVTEDSSGIYTCHGTDSFQNHFVAESNLIVAKGKPKG